ncbi:uncharacterized protein PHALS_12070 [Plasmopara halstedii]|uniref:Uncharacterized protein n=1 Tax=Plasmopara halstedii TaxID=4781 RepID=A0A0P1ALI6_PLAHL|nr:uncharacterized protein PHALS_12070 [Plasmopara halstedii]CEG41741.1 hypothetical protein PHALS_12070 [Plasmopara halstedii]|eukprot:XP_024578110.1 hypothetical protein PHALS_12070 [Plasmopara halstedii]
MYVAGDNFLLGISAMVLGDPALRRLHEKAQCLTGTVLYQYQFEVHVHRLW